MADVNASDLTQETKATLDGSEEFIMFDSTEGKRGSVADVGDYILQNGDADGLGNTVAQMVAGAGGDTVTVTQTQQSGTEIASISVNSTPTKIYSPTETDPVFSASAAAGISSSDITAWNGKSTVSFTQNQTSGDELGTITINGTGTKIYGKSYASKQDALVSGTNIKTINSTSILGSGDITTPDTHYTGYIRAGASGGTANAAASDPYLNYVENGSNRSGVQLKGGTNVTIASDANGVVTINSSGGGGGGGDTVSYTQTQTSGNELGTITINGTPSKIYGVDYSGKQDALVSGTSIKTINNESVLGSGNISISAGATTTWYGTCSTTASTTAKTVTCSGFTKTTGAVIAITFSTANTANAPTLNINSTTATATYKGNAVTSSSNPLKWDAGDTLTFMYDGSYYKYLSTSNDFGKQDALVSGTNIKTVNSTSLLGSGNVAVQETLVSGTNIKTINSTSLLGSGNIAVQSAITSTTVSITVANWNATTTCTKSVTGVTSSNNVIVTPAPASINTWNSNGVYCSAQGSGTLTFTASSTPSADMTVNVMIIN